MTEKSVFYNDILISLTFPTHLDFYLTWVLFNNTIVYETSFSKGDYGTHS